MRYQAFLLSLCVLAPLLVGCGVRKYPVQGRVEFNDATPLAAGTVVLTSEDGKHSGYGILKGVDGRFEISFDKLDDGIPAGRYKVAVRPPGPTLATAEQIRAAPGPDWGIQDKYTSEETSGLDVEITGKLTDYVIRLEKSPPPTRSALERWKRRQTEDDN